MPVPKEDIADFVEQDDLLINAYKEYWFYKAGEVQQLLNTAEFRKCYQFLDFKNLNLYALVSSLSTNRVIFETFALVDEDQHSKIRSFDFVSNALFEDTIAEVTRCRDKPNPIHQASRPWDVAFHMIIKVESLDVVDQVDIKKITLRREYSVLKYVWSSYLLQTDWEFDMMVGIPMVFDFQEVPNVLYNFVDLDSRWVDMYGQSMNIFDDKTINNGRFSSLSYMTMERLGPNVRYLMQLQSNVPTSNNSTLLPLLSFNTAFKIFDQLICRLIVIHRLGVVHYDLSPEHLYFGRAPCENVLYLNHFKSAMCVPEKLSDSYPIVPLGNTRFLPVFHQKKHFAHPIDDIESAFYVLLSMLSVTLPWDVAETTDLRFYKNNTNFSKNSFNRTSGVMGNDRISSRNNNMEVNFDNISDVPGRMRSSSGQSRGSILLDSYTMMRDQVDENRRTFGLENNEVTVNKMRDIKLNFWKNPNIMKKIVSRMDFEHREVFGNDGQYVPLATQLMMDLYLKVKDLLRSYSEVRDNVNSFCKNLTYSTSKELQHYTEVRACILLYFRFESHSDMLNAPSFLNTEKTLKSRQVPRMAWDLSSWCFSYIEIATSFTNARRSVVHTGK